jgi:hypothetical protein
MVERMIERAATAIREAGCTKPYVRTEQLEHGYFVAYVIDSERDWGKDRAKAVCAVDGSTRAEAMNIAKLAVERAKV